MKSKHFTFAFFLTTSIFAGCSHSDTLTQIQFTNQFVARLQTAAPQLTADVITDSEIKIQGSALKDLSVNLANAYAEYLKSPANEATILNQMIRSTLSESQGQAEKMDRENVLPIIKPMTWIEGLRKDDAVAHAAVDSLPYYESLNSQLAVVYVEKNDGRMRFLSKGDLDEAKLPSTDVRQLACKNLVRIASDAKLAGGGKMYLLNAGGTFDASFLLVDRFWDGHAIQVDGDYVVAIPSRGTLAITGSDDKEQIRAIQSMATKDSAGDPYAISAQLFVRKNGTWEVYKP